MKTFSIYAAMTMLAAFSTAAPLQAETRNTPPTPIDFVTFEGAPPDVAFYTRSIPVNGSKYYLNDALSISHIKVEGTGTCTFYGVDGSVTVVKAGSTVDVGPPQTQVYGICSYS